MTIMVTGATGFVGRYLIRSLLKKSYKVIAIGRDIKKMHALFGSAVQCFTWDQLDQVSPTTCNIVINLAGENIGSGRWTNAKKMLIKRSRLDATNKIVSWALRFKEKPPHIYNASAIGVHGLKQPNSDSRIESTRLSSQEPTNFLSEVASAWEDALQPAIDSNIPVTFLRFAPILDRGEGMLKKMELPFLLGLGTIIGNGEQSLAWIHIEDVVAGIEFLLERPAIVGPINFCSSEHTSQKEFARMLAKSMHRPLLFRLPSWMVKRMFGQMGEELLLGSQGATPHRLNELGFQFRYNTLTDLFVYFKEQYNHKESRSAH